MEIIVVVISVIAIIYFKSAIFTIADATNRMIIANMAHEEVKRRRRIKRDIEIVETEGLRGYSVEKLLNILEEDNA